MTLRLVLWLGAICGILGALMYLAVRDTLQTGSISLLVTVAMLALALGVACASHGGWRD